jgi:DNA-binding MarR family transcriptional regulator
VNPPTSSHTLESRDAGQPGDELDESATRLRIGIARLARRLRQEADSGLSPSQLSCLATVGRDGPLSLRSLAQRERVAAPTITGIVARLENDGLVERTPDPTDGRGKIVTITGKGRDRISEVQQKKNVWLRARLAELGDDDARALLAATDVMERLAELPDRLDTSGSGS